MANVNAPYGLRPLRYASGAPYSGQSNPYFVTGSNNALYIGDPVVLAGSSNTAEVQGFPAGTLPTVIRATAGDGNLIRGVVVAVFPVTYDSTVYRANATDRIVMVADDLESLIFVGQCDTAGSDWAATDVGSYANLLTGSGSNYSGRSGFTLDTTDGPDETDASNQLKIIRLWQGANNAIGEFAQWEVMVNPASIQQAI